jgi:hypothetical protein
VTRAAGARSNPTFPVTVEILLPLNRPHFGLDGHLARGPHLLHGPRQAHPTGKWFTAPGIIATQKGLEIVMLGIISL